MPKVARKKLPLDPDAGSKFLISDMYGKLNLDQKKIMIAEYTKRFGLSENAFYKTLKRNILSDEELLFFAEMFGCDMLALWRRPPKSKRLTVFQLEQQADKLSA